MKTISELLREGKQYLRDKVENSALDASVLLGGVLGLNQAGLLIGGGEEVGAEEKLKYRQWLERRAEGECVSYILGYKEFWGERFFVNTDVLNPRPETETLIEAALAVIDGAKNALDIGTGSGAIAIILKIERPFLEVTASDVSSKALDVARRNAETHRAAVFFIESDLFEHIDGKFDLIVSNPPYVPTKMIAELAIEVRKEPIIALDGGEDGLAILKKIIMGAKKLLNRGGKLILEASPEQMPAIKAFLSENNYDDMVLYKDLAGFDRVIRACYRAGV